MMSTTHASLFGEASAVYIAFDRSLGWTWDWRRGEYVLMDIHGAGSQRSDPKVGAPLRFPQGDVICISNHACYVRDGVFEDAIGACARLVAEFTRTWTVPIGFARL